jgi:hypothetical protein
LPAIRKQKGEELACPVLYGRTGSLAQVKGFGIRRFLLYGGYSKA